MLQMLSSIPGPSACPAHLSPNLTTSPLSRGSKTEPSLSENHHYCLTVLFSSTLNTSELHSKHTLTGKLLGPLERAQQMQVSRVDLTPTRAAQSRASAPPQIPG